MEWHHVWLSLIQSIDLGIGLCYVVKLNKCEDEIPSVIRIPSLSSLNVVRVLRLGQRDDSMFFNLSSFRLAFVAGFLVFDWFLGLG